MTIEILYKKVSDVYPYINNARTHSEGQISQIASSIKEFGFNNPILLDKDNGVIAGHGRLYAAKLLGMEEVPTVYLGHLSEAQKKAYILADNKIALNAGWDFDLLAVELENLKELDFDLSLLGFDDKELKELLGDPGNDSGDVETERKSLAERFLVPPFSILDARQGYWMERKRGWLSIGLKSELGRGDNVLGFSEACNISKAGSSKNYGRTFGHGLTSTGYGKCLETGIGEKYGREEMNGTSIFDPVLCELSYRWFCPPAGVVIDPFAGGSVRGIVAAKLNRQYIGIELRSEQVEANRVQWEEISNASNDNNEIPPVWHIGDSRHIQEYAAGVEADLVFSCPPYADLEVYSDDEADLSTLKYPEFIEAYRDIINKSCQMLKNNRFACFVVGDVRNKKGHYYNFVSDTIQAFLNAGLQLYNEAILVTCIGSLPIRAGKQFMAARKLGKTHQNVLVFIKGDAKAATEACGEIEVYDPIDELGEET
jgi:hypothetical protein